MQPAVGGFTFTPEMLQLTIQTAVKAAFDGLAPIANKVADAVEKASAGKSVEDVAMRKIRQSDPCFPRYSGDRGQFLKWLVAVEDLRQSRRIPDEAAILYATEALGEGARSLFQDLKFTKWETFEKYLKTHFLTAHIDHKLLWDMNWLKMQNGDFPKALHTFDIYRRLLYKVPDSKMLHNFLVMLDSDYQYNVMKKHPKSTDGAIELARDIYRK